MAISVPLPRLDRARVRRTVRDIRARAARLVRPARAPLRNLLASPLTGLGLAAFDIGVFQWSHRIGWMVTGVSLIVLEHVIADEE